MTFARDGAVVNEQHRSEVSEAVQALSVLPAKRADGPLIARQGKSYERPGMAVALRAQDEVLELVLFRLIRIDSKFTLTDADSGPVVELQAGPLAFPAIDRCKIAFR
jgi:hypothetical protein